MSDSEHFPSPSQSSNTQHPQTGDILTLSPLFTDGPDALTPDDSDPLDNVQLHLVDLASENAFHQITTKSADDLFHCSANTLKPKNLVSPADQVVRAVFLFHPKGAPSPRTVEVCPPGTINLECPEDAPTVNAFFSKHRFLIKKITNLLIILCATIAAATTTSAGIDPDDNDDDDHRLNPRRPLHLSIPGAHCRI